MISFELSAIDLILAISVVILVILYMTKLSGKTVVEEKPLKKLSKLKREFKEQQKEKPLKMNTELGDCPRGFGAIRKIGEDNSVSERCLGCYKIMECYNRLE
jgi:hypothetical protein